jgi:DNA-binding CsgD family transcriptional regulator
MASARVKSKSPLRGRKVGIFFPFRVFKAVVFQNDIDLFSTRADFSYNLVESGREEGLPLMDYGANLKLTRREREVLALIASGMASKQIAVVLNISTATVGNHRKNLCAKLEVHSYGPVGICGDQRASAWNKGSGCGV